MRTWTNSFFSILAAGPLLLAAQTDAKAAFCHYILGGVNPSDAQQDIDNAQAMGIDAFALDILDPTQSFSTDTANALFDYAQTKNFKLFFSMDLSSHPNLNDFQPFMQPYLTNGAYYTGPNGSPFLSTFDSGGLAPSDFTNFLQSLNQAVYFVPDFDDTQGYYDDTDGWFYAWDTQTDGAFSWETAWPRSTDTPQNESISQDVTVQGGAQNNGKTYMMPLSSFQYKHLDASQPGCGPSNQHYYRIGEVNLPERMVNILSMDTAPDFVEVITWNDAGEGHYIGNIWDESLPDCIKAYANQADWSHAGWQPLIQSFIAAYKAGGDGSTMAPPDGAAAVGAMWYRTILKDATCASDPLGKPEGWQGASDAVNWAVVLPSDTSGVQIQVSSGGTPLQTFDGVGGLNYGSVPGVQVGAQQVTLIKDGSTIMTANSPVDVAADSDGICNFNYKVVALQ